MSDDNSSSASESLWEEKYRPRSFLQLLSDDGTNRLLLNWLKLWDKVVFNKEVTKKVAAKKEAEQREAAERATGGGNNKKFDNFKNFQNRFNPLLDLTLELDDKNRPLQRVAVLHGPPGLGKTTLAHVIAKHAGYNVVEMNASDDRSLAAFKVDEQL